MMLSQKIRIFIFNWSNAVTFLVKILFRPFNSRLAYQQAREVVERTYAVVGVLEEMDKSLTVLEHFIPRFFSGAKELYHGETQYETSCWLHKLIRRSAVVLWSASTPAYPTIRDRILLATEFARKDKKKESGVGPSSKKLITSIEEHNSRCG